MRSTVFEKATLRPSEPVVLFGFSLQRLEETGIKSTVKFVPFISKNLAVTYRRITLFT